MRHRQQSLQQQQQQQHQDDGQGHGGQHGVSNGHNYQQPRLTASALARMQQFQQNNHSSAEPSTITSSSTTRSLYDVKAMQKEAVLSYVKVINEPLYLKKKLFFSLFDSTYREGPNHLLL